jgi:hypothetical protein
VTDVARAAHAGAHPHHAAARPAVQAPEHGPGAAPLATAAPVPASRPDTAHPHGGIDVGWLAACAGLVLAAGLLAGPGRRRANPSSARATFGALARVLSRT